MTTQKTARFVIAKDVKTLDKQISNAIQTANTMKFQVQQAALSIIFHAYTHKDYSRAQVLVDGLGNGVNCNALVEWFVQFGGLIVDEENKCFGGWKGQDHIKANIEQAKTTMWYDLKVQSPFKGFNLNDEINKLLVKANKMQALVDKGDEKASEIEMNTKQLAALQAIMTGNASVESATKH